MRAEPRAAAAVAGAAALWGGMYVVSKDTFDAVPPLVLTALRLLLGGVLLLGAAALAGSWRWTGSWRPLLAVSALLGVSISLQFGGTDLATARDGALLTTVTPAFLVLLAWLFRDERPGRRTLAGLALAFAGVGVSAASSAGGDTSLLGDAMLAASAATWAGYTLAGTHLIGTRGALVVTAWTTLLAGLLVTPFALAVDRGELGLGHLADPGTLAATLYLGVGSTALAWLLWLWGAARVAATVAAALFFLQPVVGGVLAAAFLDEPLHAAFVAGGVLIAAGVLLVLRPQNDEGPPEGGPVAEQLARAA